MVRGMWAILLAAILPLLGAGGQNASSWMQRYEVVAEVRDDGSMRVEESLTFYYQGRSPTTVKLTLPDDIGSEIVDIQAGYNDRFLPQGTSAYHVEILPGTPPEVIWHMTPVYDGTRRFQVNYTVLNVVRPGQGEEAVLWRPLPGGRSYYVRECLITITYPRAWAETSQPDVLEGRGWLTRKPGEASFEAKGLTLSTDSIVLSLPTGQVSGLGAEVAAIGRAVAQTVLNPTAVSEEEQKIRQDKLSGIWTWPSAIILFGGLYLAMVVWQNERRQIVTAPDLAVFPPGLLAPALAGALRDRSAAVSWRSALATLFDLAGRGYLAIDQHSSRNTSARFFTIRLKAEPFEPRPFETGLIDLLLTDEDGRRQQSVSLDRLRQITTGRRWEAWARSVEAELIIQGLLKPGRLERRQHSMRLALIPFALALAVTAIAIPFYGVFGRWPFYLVVVLLFQGLLWRYVSGRFLVLSDDGVKRAGEWERFYRYLALVSWGNEWPVSDDECADYLPYAAAYGLATSWTASFRRRGWTTAPDYFHAFDPGLTNVINHFVSMVSEAGRIMWLSSGRRQWDWLGSDGLFALLRLRRSLSEPFGWRASGPDRR